MPVIDMFDSSTCEIQVSSVADDATDCSFAAHSSFPFECCATDDIDLIDCVATEMVDDDDASLEYQIPHRQTTACEKSARQKRRIVGQ